MTPVLAVALSLLLAAGDDPALTIADLEAYRLALRPAPAGEAAKVSFRDLWEHPEKFAGRQVRVEGRLARVFRQPKVGEFPALAEGWIVTPAGDPICLVYPDDRGGPEIGAEVRFAGTFLRRVRYRGGDVPRLAPLIVGPATPELGAEPISTAWPGSSADWLIGLGAAAAVGAILAGRHLNRPVPGPVAVGPPPAFLDGDDPDPSRQNGATDEFA